MKKAATIIVNGLSFIMIVFSLFILLTVVATKKGEVPKVFGYSLLRVLTGSMEPTIPTDSLLIVKSVEGVQLKEGDIISFYSEDPVLQGGVNTHRIVQVIEENGEVSYQTKGDANSLADRYRVKPEKVVGVMVTSSLLLGKAIGLITNPIIFFPIIIIPLVIIVMKNIIQSVITAKELMKEEEEAAIREAIEEIKQEKQKKEQQKQEHKEEN